MPPRETANRYTVGDHIENIRRTARDAKYHTELNALAGLSAWELYRSETLVTNINRLAIEVPINFALKSAVSPYDVRPMARILLGFGCILFKESVDEESGGTVYDIEDPDKILYVGWKQHLGKPAVPVEVIIRYIFQRPLVGQRTPQPGMDMSGTSEPQQVDWVYFARYYYMAADDEEGTPKSMPVIDEREYELSRESEEAAKGPLPVPLDYWPYSGVRWETGDSVLEPIKPSILRVEAAWRNIMEENDLHSRRALVLENVDEVITGKREANEQGFLQTPAGSKAYYPDMHSEGMDQMFKEYELAMEEIREAVGALRVKELHNASGPSRTFELFPNIALANVIREKVREMVQTLDKNAQLDLGPLIDYTPQEIAIIEPVYAQMQLNGSMQDDEYIAKMRMLIGLPERAGLNLRALPLPVSVNGTLTENNQGQAQQVGGRRAQA